MAWYRERSDPFQARIVKPESVNDLCRWIAEDGISTAEPTVSGIVVNLRMGSESMAVARFGEYVIRDTADDGFGVTVVDAPTFEALYEACRAPKDSP
jgi:hypothetical protein